MAKTDGPTRERINVAAYELLKEKGIEGPSMRALADRKWALENPHLYGVTVSIPLLRDRIPVGLEDGVAKMIIDITGKDHEHARAVWALMHGLVDLVADSFIPLEIEQR